MPPCDSGTGDGIGCDNGHWCVRGDRCLPELLQGPRRPSPARQDQLPPQSEIVTLRPDFCPYHTLTQLSELQLSTAAGIRLKLAASAFPSAPIGEQVLVRGD